MNPQIFISVVAQSVAFIWLDLRVLDLHVLLADGESSRCRCFDLISVVGLTEHNVYLLIGPVNERENFWNEGYSDTRPMFT